MSTSTTDRRGFTLVELIVVVVLGALVIAASMEVLITNQRTYTAQSAQIQGQEATRAALDVLWGELRELSTRGGDLLGMGTDTMAVRVMRNLGIVCNSDTTVTGTPGQPLLRVIRTATWFEDQDSIVVFADNNPSSRTDDAWILAKVTKTDTTATCLTRPAEELVFSGQKALFTADSVRMGAPIRSYVRYAYGLFPYDGAYYLGRRAPGATDATPMVGPLDPTSGVQFTYMDSTGAVTTTPTEVRQIAVTIRTLSNVKNATGGFVSDSITTWIYTRN